MVNYRKLRFPDKFKGKLDPRGDGPFQVLERLSNNAYVIDLPGEYNVSATFNVADLSPFPFAAETDSNKNPSEEGGDDADIPEESPIMVPQSTRPFTRSQAKQLKHGIISIIRQTEQLTPKEYDVYWITFLQIQA